MKNNFRFILLLIIAGGAGIIIVLSSWLYGSYHQRLSLFRSTAERTLFDAIQETVQRPDSSAYAGDGRESPFSRRFGMPYDNRKQLVSGIISSYPSLNKDTIDSIVFIWTNQRRPFPRENEAPPERGNMALMTERRDVPSQNQPTAQILPYFLFGSVTVDSALLDNIKEVFSRKLSENGIRAGFTLTLVEGRQPRPPFGPLPRQFETENPALSAGVSTRPMMIDPEKDIFLTATFPNPWQYMLYSLSWQLIISLALLVVIIGGFIYLFRTIFRQNQIATLRRTFVNNMTHEFKTPVATVSAAIQALQSYGAMEEKERRERYLAVSKEELQHLSSMIDEVLLTAQGEHRKMTFSFQYYDLERLVRKSVEQAEIQDTAHEVTFTIHSSDKKTENIFGDPEHIKNVVGNLLENAVKYGAGNVSIHIDTDRKNKFAILRIADNGIGIPRLYHKQVFEPFFRVPQGDVHRVKGFGLGLSYVRQVILQHGGRFKLKSEPSQGSEFILFIPITARI